MNNTQSEMCLPLMDALYKDDFNKVIELLDNGAPVNLPYNRYKWTPFMWVCREHCNPNIIRLFLEHGADVNSKNTEGITPLHIVARHRSSFDCLALLIDAGANPNAQDRLGWTPLMEVLQHPQVSMRMDVVYGLMEKTDLSIKNIKGDTAYDIARSNKAFDDEYALELLKGAYND